MSNKINLTFTQRIIAAIAYVVIFVFLTRYFSGNFEFLLNSQNSYNQLFVSVALLLIFGSYIAEPFFTKPTDVLVNSAGIFLFLLSINNPQNFVGYEFLKYTTITLLGVSIIVILISQVFKRNKWQEAIIDVLVKIGRSKVAYSVIYIASLVSYFSDKPIEFSVFFTFWVIFISGFVVENLIIYVSRLYHHILGADKNSLFVGEAIGYENPFVFKVEIDLQRTKVSVTRSDLVRITLKGESDVFGVIVDQKVLLNKKWLTVYLLKEGGDFIRAPRSGLFRYGTLLSDGYKVHKVEIGELANNLQTTINENPLYKNRNNFIGYVEQGSDINKIKFYVLPDNSEVSIVEGTVVSTKINNKDVLFQVVDGSTKEEGLEHHDKHTFISVTARKLGKYDTNEKEIISVRWLPEMFSPVFLLKNDECKPDGYKKTIGLLPNTSYPIEIKDFNSLVTHNSAILGILGIGKSCLTFELIKKTVENTSAKVICIDITNEYLEKLESYGCKPKKINDENMRTELKNSYETIDKNIHKGGNHEEYRRLLKELFQNFIDGGEKVLTINPEDYDISKQTNDVKPKKIGTGPNDWQDQAPMSDLTVAEKTRIISETIFDICKNKGKTDAARCLIVYEEAHSLVPEWNSSANKGDDSATNGTARVILQGRKYGLGSFIITQRTANISKSILNQCNTIFALRVFDDTGKQFLENYIGSEYANTLPALEERHAISIGKALRLKQPVIIRLNDRDEIVKKD